MFRACSRKLYFLGKISGNLILGKDKMIPWKIIEYLSLVLIVLVINEENVRAPLLPRADLHTLDSRTEISPQ